MPPSPGNAPDSSPMMKPDGIMYSSPRMSHHVMDGTPADEFEAMASANMSPQIKIMNASNFPSFPCIATPLFYRSEWSSW